MGNYEEELEKYVKDTRIACKYGRKCYQTKPEHHKNFKHPPKRRPSNDADTNQEAKKAKLNDTVRDSTKKVNGTKKNDLTNYFKPVSKTGASSSTKNEETKKTAETTKECESSISNTNEETSAHSEQEKDDIQPSVNGFDKKQFIKEKFLVEMPDDFYAFYEFCKKLNTRDPLKAFADVDLFLVGPSDVLADKFTNVKSKTSDQYLIHWRYYYDPPEFQTVLKGDDKRGYHIGYFRDSPEEQPVFLANNCAEVDGVLNVMGNNIFAAVHLYLEEYKKIGDPFKKMKVGKLQAAVKAEAEKLNLSLSARPSNITSRDKKVLTRTFNRAGLVVPYNKKTQLGYRELALSNKELHSLLGKLKNCLPEQQTKLLSDLQPVITYARIALDECDFGTGLELGWNLLFYGIDCLNDTALRFLRDSYNLLHRNAFAKIAEAHLSNRRKGCNLSIL